MPVAKTDKLSGSTPLVEKPSIVNEDGTFNLKFISQYGEYFEQHFAFRPQLVTANALISSTIFKQSSTDQVVYGKNGYLYYSETLNDYFGQNLLTGTQLECIAYNLSIIQEYLYSYNKSCFYYHT